MKDDEMNAATKTANTKASTTRKLILIDGTDNNRRIDIRTEDEAVVEGMIAARDASYGAFAVVEAVQKAKTNNPYERRLKEAEDLLNRCLMLEHWFRTEVQSLDYVAADLPEGYDLDIEYVEVEPEVPATLH